MKKRGCVILLAIAVFCGCLAGCSGVPAARQITVTLDCQDVSVAASGDLNERRTVTVNAGEELKLEAAENAPYRFGGWFTAPGGAGENAEGLKPEKDLTLYAYWLGSEGLEYRDGKVRRGALDDNAESVVVAPAYNGEITTEVAFDAFSGMTNLKSAHLPDTVTKLGDNAFRYCTNLSFVKVPAFLKRIGSECFNGVDGLTSFTVPASCEYVGYGAFAACGSLAYVQFRGNVAPLTPVDLSYGHAVILVVPNGAADNFAKAYSGLNNSGNIVTVSSWKGDFLINNGVAVRYVGNDSEVTLPESVSAVKENCFYGNKRVQKITVPENVVQVQKYAFAGCPSSLELHVSFAEGNVPDGFSVLWNNDLTNTKYKTVYAEAGK